MQSSPPLPGPSDRLRRSITGPPTAPISEATPTADALCTVSLLGADKDGVASCSGGRGSHRPLICISLILANERRVVIHER